MAISETAVTTPGIFRNSMHLQKLRISTGTHANTGARQELQVRRGLLGQWQIIRHRTELSPLQCARANPIAMLVQLSSPVQVSIAR